MPETEIKYIEKGKTRESIRQNLIKEFLKEQPGTSEDTSIYYYYVDKTKEGVDVYLKRPARLNKGMDFEVHAENVIFENESESGRITRTSRPSHSTIIVDLAGKKKESLLEYKKLLSILERIFKCEIVDDKEIQKLKFKSGHSVELIIKIIKWLFIEQDVTYWNWSGRAMFYDKIKEI